MTISVIRPMFTSWQSEIKEEETDALIVFLSVKLEMAQLNSNDVL